VAVVAYFVDDDSIFSAAVLIHSPYGKRGVKGGRDWTQPFA